MNCLLDNSQEMSILIFSKKIKQESHGPKFAHLVKTAIQLLQIRKCHTTFFQYCHSNWDTNLTISKKDQRSSQSHHFKKLSRSWVPDAVYQDSASKLSWYWRRRFLSVFTIYGHDSHLVQWCRTINKLSTSLQQKAPCEIWWKLVKQFQRRDV